MMIEYLFAGLIGTIATFVLVGIALAADAHKEMRTKTGRKSGGEDQILVGEDDGIGNPPQTRRLTRRNLLGRRDRAS